MLAMPWTCAAVAAAEDDGGIISHTNSRTLETADAAYAKIPPVKPRLPEERGKRLPKTFATLRNGGTLRVVMLGDSIINDTSRSAWDLVLMRENPKVKVEKTTAVRGSTGCTWYKEAGRVKKFVLDHQPDLVIVGGISHGGDIDSIRNVIEQIQAGSKAEILLVTGPFGTSDPNAGEDWRKTSVHPNNTLEFAAGLKSLAEKSGCGFFDMQAEWGDYIRASGKKLDVFKRDPIHANAEGEQVLGRILVAYFSPTS
jgi:lysophospholipase L1-like esterase